MKDFLQDKPAFWLVDDDNLGAQIFYRKMGAKDIGTAKDGALMMCYDPNTD